jgi:hypothetical protein
MTHPHTPPRDIDRAAVGMELQSARAFAVLWATAIQVAVR